MEILAGDKTILLLVGQLVFACAMTGIIWMVQIVTYPQFLEVPKPGFLNYHDRYMQRMSWVVGPLMVAELILTVICVWYFWDSEIRWHTVIAGALVPAVWMVTFFVQVPQHSPLTESGWNETTIHEIIKGNWIRVCLWTTRTGILVAAFLKSR